ncbi:T9SS type A sorting domain-containing protein [Flavobacterium sp. MFBS3-15]|uniref:T9SS type A sorting domain-containing protein n=1 Tax=Flavobacterium sp. MFBS3-15 TaxID=2989816 RepID=UPI002236B6F3|nr:T9SS type A sorting domain-containing protein [Flavobacterium sp. MFBS3-15]MCW4467719.1 T9SS type A sorting domain-containing protein [Flavobacterium sp. MFBS3-15]
MGTFSGATLSGTAPSCTSQSLQDVWYKFTATEATMRISLSATSGLNHGFQVLQGGCGGAVMACVNATPAGNAEAYSDNTFIIGQEYHIRVLNAAASSSTASFGICVTNIPPPANDLCANAQQLIPGLDCTNTTGTFSGSLKDGNIPSCGTYTSQDVWYKFTATHVTMRIDLEASSNLNHGFELYNGGCNGTLVACVNESSTGFSENYFDNNFIVGQEYYIRVINTSENLSTRTFNICVKNYPTPANDLCANAQQLIPGLDCTNTTGTFSGSLKDGNIPSCGASTSQDVWYKFTATHVTMRIDLESSSSNLNDGFELYSGGCNGTLITCVNESISGFSEKYFNNNFIVGQEYYIRVINTSENLSTRTFNICVKNYPTPANDLCANAIQLTPGLTCTNTSGTFSGSLKDGGIPACATNASQDVWYKFTATDKLMEIDVNGASNVNIAFELYQGGCNGTLVSCQNFYSTDSTEYYFGSNFIIGQEYYIRVINPLSSLDTRNFQVCVIKYPPPANDLCANAIQLTPGLTCTDTSGTFKGALKDGGVPACATNASQDVWYKFTATDVMMEIDVDGASNVNIAFELYQGGCNGTLVACTDSFANDNLEFYFASNFIIGQEYYIRVINPLSTLDTRNFELCVVKFPPPANDLCANAIQLTPGLSCTNTTGTFRGSLKDGGIPSCAASASQDVWYKFTATDVMMEIDIAGATNVNVGFELYQGGCNGTLIACKNSFANDNLEYYFANDFIIGQEYYIRVINPISNLEKRNFELCVVKYPPPANDLCTNATQLTPGTGCNYITGTFKGSVLDGLVPTCATGAQQDVWYKFTATDVTNSITLDITTSLNHGFEIIQGGCNGTVIACVNSGGAGAFESYYSNDFVPGQEYYIRVFNATNMHPLSNFKICLTKYPTPANDLCANATEVFPGTTCTYVGGTFIGSTLDGPAAMCPSGTTTQDIWYKFVATEQTYSIYLNPVSFFNPGFQIFEGSCSAAPIACVNNFGSNVSEYYINNNFIIGQTYYVRFFNALNGYSSDNISFCITKYPKPANDTCENARVLYQNTTCSQVGATMSGAMFNGPAISCAPQAGQDVWFRFIAEGTSANIYVGPMSGRDLGFQVFDGGCSGTPIACINSVGVNLSETGTASNLIQGQEYYIRVFNVYQGLTTDTFSICVYGAIQPCNASVSIVASTGQVCAGSEVTFTATPVNGGATPQYQWKRNGNNVGTNTPVYATSNLVNGDNISVVMTSSVQCPSVPTVASNIITMTVATPVVPVFTQVSAICTGGTFSLPATSNNGVTGTWSPAINNMATTTYTFTPNTGQCASVTTMTVAVNSSITPTFTQVPAICTGGTFNLPSTSNNGISGTWSPALNNTATTTYTFTPNAGQCAVATSMTVTVNSNNVTPVFTQIGAICSGGTIMLPAVSNNGISGIWSPSVNNTATTTYTFTPNAGQCAIPVTMTVTVNSNVTPTFVQVPAICEGGSFSLPVTSTNGISGTWSPAINNTATTTYVFTPNAGQCAVFTTMTVNVTNSVTPTFTQVPAICQGGTFTLPVVSNNGITGTWSPAVNNNTTTTYTFTPNAGQCATTATMTVTVNNNVTPVFSQVAAICPGGSFTLPTVSTNGIIGTWSPAVNNNATTTYTFTPNAGQCASTATMTVTVNSSTTPTFNQIAPVCQGGSFTLPTISNNGIAGTWSPAVNSNATTTYTFTPNAGQCAAQASMTVIVNIINAGVTVADATITASATGASYQWINCETNQPINDATGTSFIATTNGSYAVIVTQNGCSETSQCISITNLAKDVFVQKGWKVYPNPVVDQLFIETEEATDIVITDMTGKTVSSQSLNSGINTIDTGSLSAGMYFVKSISGTHVKFIKR